MESAAAEQQREADVVVVGAGIAGLAAARRLVAHGRTAIVLEARDRVGGRTLNMPVGDGQVAEIGGQWVGPTQERVLELIGELGLETFPTHTEGRNLLRLGGKLKRYSGTIPRISPLVLLDVDRARRRFDRLARTLPPEAPWRAPGAGWLDAQTLEGWLRSNVRTRRARRLFEIACGTVWGMAPGQMSLLWALHCANSAGGFDALIDVEGGAQQDRVVGGSQAISERMAAALDGSVRTASPVSAIEQDGSGVVVRGDGLAARGRRAIVAMAPGLTTWIRFEPVLSGRRDQLAQRMASGALTKCTAVYPEPFWREDGLTGEALNDEGVIETTFDNSPPDGSPGVLVGFIPGAKAIEHARRPESERRRLGLESLAELFGDAALQAGTYFEQAWAEEQWSAGGPVAGAGRPERLWRGADPALGQGPLGRRRDRVGLVRLHGGGGPQRGPRRRGGPGFGRMEAVSDAGANEELAFAGAAHLAGQLREKQVSSRDLTEMYLERIDRIDPGLNSFRVVWRDEALAAADEADRRLAAGESAPLLGVPIAIKDTLDVAGDVTMFGTAGYEQPAAADSELVKRLRAAGSVILGKTNLPELAIHGFTESKTFGDTRNPWDTSRTPGGSSGGSGAAVAAGLAALAHASDGAGSIRYPAANCGLFGLKPQRDRVPIDAEHWFGMSANGCVTRTVADTALFLDTVTAGPAWSANAPPPPERSFGEAAAAPPGKLRIVASATPPRAIAKPLLLDESRQAFEETVELLASLGHTVIRKDPDWGSIGNQIPARYLGGIAEDIDGVPHRERLEKQTLGYRRLARLTVPGWAVRRSVRLERSDSDRINRIFDDADVLLTPMTAGPAVEIGHWHGKGAVRTILGQSRWYPYAVPWNHTGQPAASVPAKLSSGGLPLAVQLVAPPNGEATLLSLAAQLESERPWAQRRPSL